MNAPKNPEADGNRRIVVKVGSQVLCDDHGALNLPVLGNIARQVSKLAADGWRVLLVSSGAVAAGAATTTPAVQSVHNPVVRKQVLAAAGQVELMRAWRQHLGEHDLGSSAGADQPQRLSDSPPLSEHAPLYLSPA